VTIVTSGKRGWPTIPDFHLIKSVDLAADSRHQARYHVRLYELPHGSGFVVSKLSGPAGKEKASEEWFRPCAISR
jgi:hypothetical protein